MSHTLEQDDVLIVTTELIPGRTIRYVIGEVIGVTARMNNVFTEGLRELNGASSSHKSPSLLRWRWDAISEMAAEANRLGADAIIGMKFDNRQITGQWSEICAYGTAVRLAD
jgi:uncharacterized protein YbjQ (UPF0145 family)